MTLEATKLSPQLFRESPDQSLQEDDLVMRVLGLNAYYADSRYSVVNDINLDIQRGSTTAIIGPSGCGKSTLLWCLNRMHETRRNAWVEGQVLLQDQPLYSTDLDPIFVRKQVGMVFQKPNPFPKLSILENVTFGLTSQESLWRYLFLGQACKRRFNEIAEEALTKVALLGEVKDKLHKPATELSGGQQQRLCIARALAMKPRILLMDEPCSALDPISAYKIEQLIDEISSQGTTIIIVTHNMQQAARVSDRTVFMMSTEDNPGGHIVEKGITRELFMNPKHPDTQKYITGRFG